MGVYVDILFPQSCAECKIKFEGSFYERSGGVYFCPLKDNTCVDEWIDDESKPSWCPISKSLDDKKLVEKLHLIRRKLKKNWLNKHDLDTASWIWNPETQSLSCSRCGEEYDFDSVDTALTFMDSAKFCMSCGAKMRDE